MGRLAERRREKRLGIFIVDRAAMSGGAFVTSLRVDQVLAVAAQLRKGVVVGQDNSAISIQPATDTSSPAQQVLTFRVAELNPGQTAVTVELTKGLGRMGRTIVLDGLGPISEFMQQIDKMDPGWKER